MPTWPLGSGHHEDEDVRRSENEGFGQDAAPYHGEEQGHDVRVTEVRDNDLQDNDLRDDDLRDADVVDTDARDAGLQDVDAQDRYPQNQDVPVASSPAQTTDNFPAQNTPIQDNQVEDTRVDGTPAQDTPVQDTPVTNPPSAVEHSLLEPGFADTFQQRWREIQASFVDDPHETVREADQLADEVVNKLTTALTDRKHSLDERWQGDKENTEELRLALRGYRELLDRLIKL